MIQKLLGFGFLFVLAPFCMGLLPAGFMGDKKRRAANIYLSGFLMELAVFQLIAVPVMILKARGMKLLVLWVTAALLILSAAGVAVALREMKKRASRCGAVQAHPAAGEKETNGKRQGDRHKGSRRKDGRYKERLTTDKFTAVREVLGLPALHGIKKLSAECRFFWLLALAVIGFQMYMGYAYAMFDGDDAYYVVNAVLADQTGVLNRILPYTGLSSGLDIRHALAALPLWEAYVARLTGIHAAIVAHSLLPLVIIPLTYLCYFEIGRKLLGAANSKLPVFLTLAGIMQIWGNTSIYTNATFFVMRTWQGKSMLANLVLLAILWLLLEIFDGKQAGRKSGFFAMLVVTNIVAAMMTSMGAFLAALLIAVVGLIGAVRLKSFRLLWGLAACCIPNVIYLALLLALPAML